jgi:spore coat polysaccharide biosynthesis predicted glycosyltransferase SpsG
MYPTKLSCKRILISPLNWGQGHVSRCIPLIKRLKNQRNELFIACNKNQREIFETYLNLDLTYINHEGYTFKFGGKGRFVLDILFNLKVLLARHKSELKEVSALVKQHNIDLIISDHRYGFRSEKCTSIFMTHQLQLPLPWYLKPAQIWHKKQVSNFNFQWVVDDEKKRLAGKLSNIEGFNKSQYIGLLSRFDRMPNDQLKIHDGILLISGPLEYCKNLIKTFEKQLDSGAINLIIGNKDAYEVYKSFGLKQPFFISNNWLNSDELIKQSRKIYGYFGYSTLMDLEFLNCDSELIACPGQFEQLYLQKKS